MAKEKKSILDEEKKDLTFYYEVVGIICLLITILGFARLGTVGYYISLLFKIGFGDWYFLFLGALSFVGLHGLVYHKPLKVKNMRSIGIVMLLTAVLMFSHFSMHNYIATIGEEYLTLTTNLYFDYFQNYQEGMILGGGLIGSVLFYITYTLFSSVGTVVIIALLVFVGLAFTCKKTVAEFSSIILGFVKGSFGKTRKLFKSLKYEIIKDDNHKAKKKVNMLKSKSRKVTTEILDPALKPLYLASEEKHAEGVLKSINSVLDLMNINKRRVSYLISCHVTSYMIETVQKIDETNLNARLNSVLNDDFLIKRENEENLLIEVNNIHENKINLKNLIGQSTTFFTNLSLFAGEATDKKALEIDLQEINNLLIVGGSAKSEVLLHSYIIQLCLKNKQPIVVSYYHLLSTVNPFANLSFSYSSFSKRFDMIKQDIDERLNVLNTHSCNCLGEFNQKKQGVLEYQVIIVNGFEKLFDENIQVEDIHYLLQLGPKAGYYFIFRLTTNMMIPSVILGLLVSRLFLPNDFDITKKNLGVDTLLLSAGEGIYLYRHQLKRFSMPEISISEIEKFCKCFSE